MSEKEPGTKTDIRAHRHELPVRLTHALAAFLAGILIDAA